METFSSTKENILSHWSRGRQSSTSPSRTKGVVAEQIPRWRDWNKTAWSTDVLIFVKGEKVYWGSSDLLSTGGQLQVQVWTQQRHIWDPIPHTTCDNIILLYFLAFSWLFIFDRAVEEWQDLGWEIKGVDMLQRLTLCFEPLGHCSEDAASERELQMISWGTYSTDILRETNRRSYNNRQYSYESELNFEVSKKPHPWQAEQQALAEGLFYSGFRVKMWFYKEWNVTNTRWSQIYCGPKTRVLWMMQLKIYKIVILLIENVDCIQL